MDSDCFGVLNIFENSFPINPFLPLVFPIDKLLVDGGLQHDTLSDTKSKLKSKSFSMVP